MIRNILAIAAALALGGAPALAAKPEAKPEMLTAQPDPSAQAAASADKDAKQKHAKAPKSEAAQIAAKPEARSE